MLVSVFSFLIVMLMKHCSVLMGLGHQMDMAFVDMYGHIQNRVCRILGLLWFSHEINIFLLFNAKLEWLDNVSGLYLLIFPSFFLVSRVWDISSDTSPRFTFAEGHGNEADFLGFLQKLVPHRSLTLPFQSFHFWLRICGDIQNRKTTPDSASWRLSDSASRGVSDSPTWQVG